MPWTTVLSDRAEMRLRIVLLAIAVLASVLLPYLLLQRTISETQDASTWVTHSADVKQTTTDLMYVLRDIENVLLAMYTGAPPDGGEAIYANGRGRIGPLLERLAALTRDNPDQQARVGSLEAVVDGRVKLLDASLQALDAKSYDAAGESLSRARELFAFRAPAQAILEHEQQLYAERSAVSGTRTRQARLATLGAFAAQLVLLGSVIFLSERQTSRRMAAEQRASLAVARSRSIVQNIREPILLLDASLCLLMTNAAFREVYGGDGDQVGAALATLGGGAWNDPALLQRLTDVAARGRELWDHELAQTTADGPRTVLVNARRIDLPEVDAAVAVLLTATDVTARKHSEQRVLELNRELEDQISQVSEVNRELEAFSYSVSHDLRAPLRHIAGFADKLGIHLGAGADERAHHYLEVIGSAARRMSSLIEDLLQYSRLGRNALRLQPVDMAALVAEASSMLGEEVGGRIVRWAVGRLPIVVADETMMRQVWQNLLSNAVKYTARRDEARIEVGVDRSDSSEIVFFVRDNGTGFDMEYAGKLFGVFQRLHKASDFPGTGIGLANVRRIVSRHGGRTWADSTPDQGATFYFSLPSGIVRGNPAETGA